jgi:large subunit ribosomal protein L6
MSRIGNKPIPVPQGVKIALHENYVDVQGPKGKMTLGIPRGITFEQKDGVLNAKRASEEHRALHGLARALVANAVHGVTQGFKKELDIVGVGYRAELKGKAVSFALGKSHPIEFKVPEGIQIAVDKQTHIIVSGANKEQVGQVAADIRALRPPDPYKQKGIRITGERLKKKAGKAGAAKAGGAAA